MIWDFMGRWPLLARDYVDLIKNGPLFLNKMSKIRQVHVWRNKVDEKLKRKHFLALFRHTVPYGKGSAAYEILKIIESPLVYGRLSIRSWRNP